MRPYRERVPGSVQSIERAAAILHLLAANSGQLSLTELASSLDLAKGTAHGILRTLQDVGFVEQDNTTARYRLGPALLRLGTSYLDVNELRSRAINWADALASHTGETVRIGTLLHGQVLIVHHVFRPDDSPQTLDVGTLMPAHASALGKALLAYAPAQIRQLGTLERFTPRTITNRRALNTALTDVRSVGWAVEVEERVPGWASVAAPIRGQGGLVVGSIAVFGPADRLCNAHGTVRTSVLDSVTDCSRAISRELESGRR